MNKAIKIASAAVIAAAASGVAIASVQAWGDNTGGRKTYTVKQINDGVLGDNIVFNSISDEAYLKDKNVLTDERYFVGARVDDGDNGKNNVWSSNTIEAVEGKTYVIRIYAHNNNPKGKDAIAKDVTTSFSLGGVVDSEQRVDGYINSSNATPSKYWDSVVFKSSDGRKFYLDYIEGSALLENNGIGKDGGYRLSDDIIKDGVKIGYEKLGEVPGCYEYANYVTIKVTPVFEDSSIDKKVRLVGEKEWKQSVDAKVGDKVEYQIHYKNMNASTVSNVIISDSLPDNMKYIEGSTKLYNTQFPQGASTDDNTIITDGVNIGNYGVKGDGYVRFTAEVIDKNLACGNNRLINWAKASANGFAVQNSADVYVAKTCEEQPEPEKLEYTINFIDCDNKKTTKTVTVKKAGDPAEVTSPWGDKYTVTGDKTINELNCKTPDPEQPKPKPELPNTGAGLASGAIALGSIVTAGGYYIASRKQLR